MHVTITGGFGFVGSHCAEYFKEKGHDVTIFARHIPPFMESWAKNYDVVIGDIKQEEPDLKGDMVIHCASVNETKGKTLADFIETNCTGTRNVIQSCIANNVKKFLKVSTIHAYGIRPGIITEESSHHPETPYGISHMLSDQICMSYANKIDTTVVRMSNTFGPPVNPHIDRWTLVVNNFCLQAVKTAKIVLNTKGHQRRDFVDIREAVRAFDFILKHNKYSGSIFNVGGECILPIQEVALRVAAQHKKRYDKDVSIILGDKEETVTGFMFSIEKLKKLGFIPKENMNAVINSLFDVCEKI